MATEAVLSEKPDFMLKRTEYTVSRTKQKYHCYSMPEAAEEIIQAIQWMMTIYDNVESEYGEEYGVPYCYLTGVVK